MSSTIKYLSELSYDNLQTANGDMFWRELKLITDDTDIDVFEKVEADYKNLFFVSSKGSELATVIIALLYAAKACKAGRKVLVVDVNETAPLLTSHSNRESKEGWIDTVRYGVSLDYVSNELPFSENGFYVTAGSYVPYLPEAKEASEFVSMAANNYDLVIYITPNDDKGEVWKSVTGGRIVCTDFNVSSQENHETIIAELSESSLTDVESVGLNKPVPPSDYSSDHKSSSSILKIAISTLFICVIGFGIWIGTNLLSPKDDNLTELAATKKALIDSVHIEQEKEVLEEEPEIKIVEEELPVLAEANLESKEDSLVLAETNFEPKEDSHTLHIFSFKDSLVAASEVERLSRLGLFAASYGCSDGYFRVCVGDYPDIETAKAEKDSILKLVENNWAAIKEVSSFK